MKPGDLARFAMGALLGSPVRGALLLLALTIGVSSVIVLTSLGEGARNYVTDEFTSLGSHLLVVLPGRSETKGAAPPILGETARDLTIDDAVALTRSPAVDLVAPINVGEAEVSRGSRSRDGMVLGTTAEFAQTRRVELAAGTFLPGGDPHAARSVCLLGDTLRRELFGNEEGLGSWIRIGDRRFRVIGFLSPKGRSMGVTFDDVVIIPVASAQMLFDTPSLFRLVVSAPTREDLPRAEKDIAAILRDRHDGEEDVTIISQDSVLGAFDRIFTALTVGVACIAGISLFVSGILVMNVMVVAVGQRTSEIGLLKAIGAPDRQVLAIFLAEAGLLCGAGAACGVLVGLATNGLLGALLPVIPIAPPVWSIPAAVLVAVTTGMVFAILPARRAARLEPVLALSRR